MHVVPAGIQYLEDDIEYSIKSRHEENFIEDDTDLEDFRKSILSQHLELFEPPSGPTTVPAFSIELMQDPKLLNDFPRVKPGRYNAAKRAVL